MSQKQIDVESLDERVTVLERVLRQTDDRTQRGEALLMSIQGAQRKMSKTLGKIVEALKIAD